MKDLRASRRALRKRRSTHRLYKCGVCSMDGIPSTVTEVSTGLLCTECGRHWANKRTVKDSNIQGVQTTVSKEN